MFSLSTQTFVFFQHFEFEQVLVEGYDMPRSCEVFPPWVLVAVPPSPPLLAVSPALETTYRMMVVPFTTHRDLSKRANEYWLYCSKQTMCITATEIFVFSKTNPKMCKKGAWTHPQPRGSWIEANWRARSGGGESEQNAPCSYDIYIPILYLL